MKAIATKQPTNESAKQNKSGEKGRSRSVSPLSTGMPLLQRKCACGGGCPRCKEELGIQTKLKISKPGDKYEQEADRIADKVMRMPEPTIQHQVEPEAIANTITPLQRRSADRDRIVEVPPIVNEVLNSQGQPLDTETRTFMEPRIGHDFSQVRLHTDGEADESSRAIGASAYTVQNHVVFARGNYAPESAQGRQLLAHELTHVVQQRAGLLQTPPLVQRQVESDGVTSSQMQGIEELGNEATPTATKKCYTCDLPGNSEIPGGLGVCCYGENAPIVPECFDLAKKIFNNCKDGYRSCHQQSQCAQCRCIGQMRGEQHCQCTGIV